MAKRLFDIVAALAGLIICAPLMLLTAVGIRLTAGAPVLYRAQRCGKGGHPFTLIKFRTMLQAAGDASAITAHVDGRVFALGKLLRKTKIDELPQLLNVLRGDMSIVGPRPEDTEMVRQHYGELGWQSLLVRPGLAGLGSLYNYTHGEQLIGQEDPERDYVQNLLPTKLALESVYLARQSMLYDLRLILRTLRLLVVIAMGKRQFSNPPEFAEAQRLLASHQGIRKAEVPSPVFLRNRPARQRLP